MKQHKSKLSRIFAILTGIVFVFSAFTKMNSSGRFGELIVTYGLPYFSILAPLIIFVEFVVGVCLLLDIYPRITAILGASMLLVFTSAFFYANVFNSVTDCGCFGSYAQNLPPWLTYLRNLLLLFMCAFVVKYGQPSHKYETVKISSIIIASIIASFVIGTSWHIPASWLTKLQKPNPLMHTRIDEGPLSKFVTLSNDSTYAIWVYSYSCPSCMNSIANARDYLNKKVVDKFIPISVTEDVENKMHLELDIPWEAPNAGESLAGYIVNLPTLLLVKNGEIQAVIERELPSAYFFKTFYIDSEEDTEP